VGIRKWFFPYTVSLEERVRELTKERDDLLNRLLHAYSGYELRQPVPSYAEANGLGQPAATKAPTGDEVLGRGRKSTMDLMAEYEEACLAESQGIANVTARAERQRVEEENLKAAEEYEDNKIKAQKQAAAESGRAVM